MPLPRPPDLMDVISLPPVDFPPTWWRDCGPHEGRNILFRCFCALFLVIGAIVGGSQGMNCGDLERNVSVAILHEAIHAEDSIGRVAASYNSWIR